MTAAWIVLAGLLMVDRSETSYSLVTVKAMSPDLRQVRSKKAWSVPSEILTPLHPLPGGRMLVVLRTATTKTHELALWTKEGQELGRKAIEVEGEVVSMRVFGDRLVLATADHVREYDTSTLAVKRVRAYAPEAMPHLMRVVAPGGIWVTGDSKLLYFDLDGNPPVARARPFAADLTVGARGKVPWTEGLRGDRTKVMVSEVGDILVEETFLQHYPYDEYGNRWDSVFASTVTVLDTKGQTVGQKRLSWMKPTREWFYIDDEHNNPSFNVPGGLVRTRYGTEEASVGMPEASWQDRFIFANRNPHSDRMSLSILNRHLETTSARSRISRLIVFQTSSPWTKPNVLVDQGGENLMMLSEDGKVKTELRVDMYDVGLERELRHLKRERIAIGQDTDGSWLLIAY
jgi:hypothetical protein